MYAAGRVHRRERDLILSAPRPPERTLEEALHPFATPRRRRILGRLLLLAIMAGSLYLLAPSIVSVLASWPRLADLSPGWFAGVVAGQVASFVCLFFLQRLALRTDSWFPVVTSQLAGNAFSRVVPGGAAAGAALQFRMLATAGADITTAASGLTAFALLQTASVLAMPLLTLPTILGGAPVHEGLAQSAFLGVVAFVVVAAVGALLVLTDRPLTAAAGVAQTAKNRMARKKPPGSGLPERMLQERNVIRGVLGARWQAATIAIAGKLGFDFLSLLAALAAVGSRPKPSVVLLAFSASLVLAMIPITPGGLGFVEAGLYATLTLAGVSSGDAGLATLAYRLASYWLPIVAGAVAYALFRRRYPVTEPELPE